MQATTVYSLVQGNVVLTDASYVVTASWRQFKNDEGLAVRIGCTYPIKQYLSAATRLDTFTRNWEALSVGIDEAQRNIQEQGDKKKKEKKSKGTVPFVYFAGSQILHVMQRGTRSSNKLSPRFSSPHRYLSSLTSLENTVS